MQKVGEINPAHFENIFLISTNDVVITEERIEHIKERHPLDYERYAEYIPKVLKEPDYIIEANRPNSAVLLKEFTDDEKCFKLVLRLRANNEKSRFSNSIISFWKIDKKDWNRLIANKKILYKSE
ncbi:MAG: PBECR2 nuclease fold domain-containing protein [Oscillospiraceae bacterium]|nr:PBECR2 nuclease fold domain-containing protein [Oscillospiraceae bacterium]